MIHSSFPTHFFLIWLAGVLGILPRLASIIDENEYSIQFREFAINYSDCGR